jgi:molecular chaperone DnaK (HSP70)
MDQNNNGNNNRYLLFEDVQWVITVPTIWDDAAKQVMRRAAENAGLPRSIILANYPLLTDYILFEGLVLALEPEVAALSCHRKKELVFRPSTKYMIVDCGGGTVDIAVHELDDQGNFLSSFHNCSFSLLSL